MKANIGTQKSTYENVDELAAELGLSRASVYIGLKAGKIPAIRIGKRFILPRAAITNWLETAGGANIAA